MKRSFIIKDASDDMPPNEGEGAIHIIRGGIVMNQDIDVAIVREKTAEMRAIASNILTCKGVMQYNYNGSIKTDGEYAAAFGEAKTQILLTISDIAKFISAYADVVDAVADNFSMLDGEMESYFHPEYWC